MGAAAWCSTHAKEHEFQRKKERAHLLASISQGHLLNSQVSAYDRAAAAAEHERLCNLDAKRTDAQERQEARVRKKSPVDLTGKTVFYESEQERAQVARAAGELKLVAVGRMKADIFCTIDPSAPGQRTEWASSLRGGLLVTPKFICSKGSVGAAVQKLSAMDTKRFIWVSDDFAAQHKMVHQLLCDSVKQKGRWQLLRDRAAFEKHMKQNDRRRVRCRRNYETIGLVTVAEKKRTWKALKNVTTIKTFLPLLSKVHVEGNRLNLCGR